MKKIFLKLAGLVLAIVSICLCFSLTGFAAEEWTYADKLPDGVTADKYYVEYKNIYRTVATAAPGSDWTNKGLNKVVYQNTGDVYFSSLPMATSSTRVLVDTLYYHYCSANTGQRVNFYMSETYHHYDGIPGNGPYYEYAEYIDDEDSRYRSYHLKSSVNGSDIYCSSGFSCDGQWGSHGGRSNLWYKGYYYQDKVQVNYYNYEKQSSWTSDKDTSATDYTVRYKLKHTHSYGDWAVTRKATLTEDGVRYRICKACKEKQTAPIYKPTSFALSATSYTYDGKVKTPTVTVKDRKGTVLPTKRYSVSYSSGRKNIGTYKVKITFKGAFYSGSKTLTYKIIPGQVKNLKAAPKKDAVALTWSKVSGSVQYRIYSYNTSTKKYTYLATTSSTSYTLKKLKSSSTYYYVVRAYKKVGDTGYSGKISSLVKCQPYGTPSKVTGLACSEKTTTTVTLKWNKASGNKVKYYIYSYNSSTKKYTNIGSTTSTTYKVTGLKVYTSYKYSVRAYSTAGEGYYGSRSDILTVKTNKQPTVPAVKGFNTSTEKKLNNMLITWSKDSSVSGYQIYKSTSTKSSSFKKLKTLSTKYTSYRDTDVKPGVTYYYKMRAYKKVDGEVFYGKFGTILISESFGGWIEKPGISNFSYNFGNWYTYFGYTNPYYIPKSSYQLVFGKTAFADMLYKECKDIPWDGNCHGMCSTSAMMNVRKSGVTVSSFNSGVSKVSQLGVNDKGSLGISVKQFIEAMQVSQYSYALEDARVWDDYQSLLNEVCRVPYTGKPVVVSVKSRIPNFYHALLALRAVKMSDKEIYIEVYDPNYPGQLKNLVLYTNTSGKVTGWYYKASDDIELGTHNFTCEINYLTYEAFSKMWTKRGTFTSSMIENNALMVNSGSVSIYDGDNNLVGSLVDGRLVTQNDRVKLIETQSLASADADVPYMLYLPADETYTVVNNDSTVDLFEAKMANVDRTAEVATESDTVTFTVSDRDEVNEVSVEAARNEDYEIILDFSDSLGQDKIEVDGEGKGKTVVVAQVEDETELKNCEENS